MAPRSRRRAAGTSAGDLGVRDALAMALRLLDTHEYVADVEAALQQAVEADFRFRMMDARLALARLCALDGRDDEARRWFAASRTVLDAQSARPLRAVVDHDEAIMHIRRGNHESAGPPVTAAAAQFRVLGMRGWTQRLSNLAVLQPAGIRS